MTDIDNYVPTKRSTFLYFAYGSNLWTNRLRLQNPTAERKTIAKLKNYRLDFFKPERETSIWNGSSATIEEDDDGKCVWGAVWEIDLTDMASLDCQEGVHLNYYIPLIKEVETLNGEILECRTYQMLNKPKNKIKLSQLTISPERQPSRTYLEVIHRGAIESKLPEEYITFLKKIVHNGKDAHLELIQKLNM